jgi:hypothetical protein
MVVIVLILERSKLQLWVNKWFIWDPMVSQCPFWVVFLHRSWRTWDKTLFLAPSVPHPLQLGQPQPRRTSAKDMEEWWTQVCKWLSSGVCVPLGRCEWPEKSKVGRASRRWWCWNAGGVGLGSWRAGLSCGIVYLNTPAMVAVRRLLRTCHSQRNEFTVQG